MLKNTGKNSKITYKTGILGLGEVGSAIKKLVAEKYPVYGRDRNFDEIGGKKIDVLHVCIPYSDNFVDIVVSAVEELKPELLLIESTVKMGTTRKIGKRVECFVCHSPVRGIHPNLYKGIKTFVKMVGGINSESAKKAHKYYRSLGLNVFYCVPSEITEAVKLWSTTYYALCIVFEKEVYKFCQKNKLDFSLVYDYANQTYNEGYKKLGKANVVRPVLKEMPGPISGHCLMENVKLIELGEKNHITQFILKRNNTY